MSNTALTKEQEQAIKCAHADLQGALESYEQSYVYGHDWKAHKLSIQELEEAFPQILKKP